MGNLKNDECGAIVAFVGTVRGTTGGRKVAFLEIRTSGEKPYEKLREVASEIHERWHLKDVAICRRTGKLKVGEIALVVAVAAPHRQEAFEATQYAVDRIKQGGITTETEIYATV